MFIQLTWQGVKSLPTTKLSSSIQGWGLISGLLSPTAICGSTTETYYLAFCARLDMELFIRSTLSCLLCPGFITTPAMCGRQYLWLVSCTATCLLFQLRWAWALVIYHPLRGSLIKNPTPPPLHLQDTSCRRQGEMSKNLLSAHAVATPGLDVLYRGGELSKKDNTPPFPFRWSDWASDSHPPMFWNLPRPSYSSCFHAR